MMIHVLMLMQGKTAIFALLLLLMLVLVKLLLLLVEFYCRYFSDDMSVRPSVRP